MALCFPLLAMAADGIKEESQVPAYQLPSVTADAAGKPIMDALGWREHRRHLLEQFGQQMYGVTPLGRPAAMKFVVREQKNDARGGRATRWRVGVLFEGTEDGRQMELLVYLPNDVTAKVPVFLGLNFDGNYTTVTDADLPLPKHYATGLFDNKTTDHVPTENARGMHAYMWSLDVLLESGCGLATAACGELEPDAPGRWQHGVRGLAKEPGPQDWGAIGAWAWGLSRAMDYLETNDRVDAKKVTVMGFSRLGKTAMWAGAQDERFAAVVSNASGAGGIALSKRIFGERVGDLCRRFPHWFCGQFASYAEKEETLPFDQHQLAALIAPRPLLATSGTEDLWSDPHGEFLSLAAAAPAYELLGVKNACKADKWPDASKLINSPLGYFMRKGGHDVTLEDWRAMISFGSKQLGFASPPATAMERYSRRLATLPAEEKGAWEAYFKRSDAARASQSAQLTKEAIQAGLPVPTPAPGGESFKMDDDDEDASEFSNEEGGKLANVILSWQLPSGGWSKGIAYAAARQPGMSWTTQNEATHYAGTFDNRSTTEQLAFLAKRYTKVSNETIKAALERGVDYVLEAQFPTGGWPQVYPLEGGYHDSITINDDAQCNVLELLLACSQGNEWAWLDVARRQRATTAFASGLRCLLALQVTIDGKRTIWPGQADMFTQAPVGARGFELTSLSTSESVEVLRLLFKVVPTTPEITTAVDAAMLWFAEHQTGENTQEWARFYDLRLQKPFYPGKTDGRAWPTETSMRKVNPGGYDFQVKKPRDLPKWHAKWLKKLKAP